MCAHEAPLPCGQQGCSSDKCIKQRARRCGDSAVVKYVVTEKGQSEVKGVILCNFPIPQGTEESRLSSPSQTITVTVQPQHYRNPVSPYPAPKTSAFPSPAPRSPGRGAAPALGSRDRLPWKMANRL